MHWHVCRFLARSVLDCRRRNGILLVAAGSAIEPWAIRAAELYDAAIIRVSVGSEKSRQQPCEKPSEEISIEHDAGASSRDQILIGIADRIDASHVRRGGQISGALHARLKRSNDASIRVAVAPTCKTHDFKSDALALIQAGAVGWFDPGLDSAEEIQHSPEPTSYEIDCSYSEFNWAKQSGQWLVHCTRAPSGPWPDQTINQYRDSMILGDATVLNRQPLDSLQQILRSGRLLASSVATSKDFPVACLTENSLIHTLSQRCFRPHLGRWDYEPFGIAVRMSIARSQGCQPVIYGEPAEKKKLNPDQRFRFHPIGKTYDWRQEREWRCPHSLNLNKIAVRDLQVFALRSSAAEQKLEDCRIPITWVDAKNAAMDLHEPCQEK